MEFWLWSIISILIFIILFLLVKLSLLQKSIKEIEKKLKDWFIMDTNTLIDISSHNRNIRSLAECINVELRKLRKERHRFQQGDFELKEAVMNISHDLRTPLTAICGYLDLLEQEETSEPVKQYLDIIKNRTEVLKQLIEELFRYFIFTSAVHDTSYEEVILNYVLEDCISVYYAALKGCNITPNISIPEKKITRKLNKNALSRILGNIISNAIKYSDGDLSIQLCDSGEMIFSNHSSQLNEIQAGKLFDRFYTVETATKSTGLGLAIAKALTEQMNGTIRACYIDQTLEIHLMF